MDGLTFRWKKTLFRCLYITLVSLWIGDATGAEDTGWPREIDTPKGKIVIYQPQVESLEGDKLKARAAVSVTLTGAEPIFGAVWFDARVMTDRDTRMVSLLDVFVPELKFPNATPEQGNRLAGILKQEILKWDLTISLDRLLTALALVEQKKAAARNLKTDPPVIRFVQHPTVLVLIDGKPELSPIENSNLRRVANTPFLIVLEPESTTYYLKGGPKWFSAADILGPWLTAANPPAEVTAIATDTDSEITETPPASSPPDPKTQIFVATQPTELVISDGAPKYTPITGTGLLSMSNTESDVFIEIASQRYYVLLAGRWFSSGSTSGPWAYVPADKLPADFAKIPPDSDKGEVRAPVAGDDTNE
jgi:hypothetical protein